MSLKIANRLIMAGAPLLSAFGALAAERPWQCPSDITPWTEPQMAIIGHRGTAGYVPEHTLASYALAAAAGADYVELDLVSTKDGQLVPRHDNQIDLTTDVADHPEFADRRRTQTVDGIPTTGWFSEDFTLAELKTLRAKERIPKTRPGNARLDGAFQIPTMQEAIDLVKGMECSLHRRIGLYIETKHPTHFAQIGLPLEQSMVNILARNGYTQATDPVIIQSFEVNNLRLLNHITNLRLVQLYDMPDLQPYDQQVAGTGLTYAQMATPEGFRGVAEYADGVGPDKSYIIPRNSNDNLTGPTRFVADAHAAGLVVHPYTFRAENQFLPASMRSSADPNAWGDLPAELRAFANAGIDGLFTDEANVAVSTLRP